MLSKGFATGIGLIFLFLTGACVEIKITDLTFLLLVGTKIEITKIIIIFNLIIALFTFNNIFAKKIMNIFIN